jgi:hypothetical protein
VGAETAAASIVGGMLDGAVSDTGGVLSADFTSLLVPFVFSDTTVAAATDAAADAVAGELIGGEVSSDGTDLGTGGVGGADSSLLSVLFVFLDTKMATAADSVTGVLVGFEKSDGAISYTGGVIGAGFTSLLILFAFSDMTVAAAIGAAADAVTGALVVTRMSSDGALSLEVSK